MMFGREVLTLEKAKISLNSKELKKKIIDSREGNDGVGLVACGRLRKRESKGKNKSHFKWKFKNKCFVCQKEGHFRKKKKNYLERKKRLKEKENGSNNPTMASKGYESANVLSISTKKKWY